MLLCTKCGKNVKLLKNAAGENTYATPNKPSKNEEIKIEKEEQEV